MKSGFHIHSVGRWKNSPEKDIFLRYQERLKTGLHLHEYTGKDGQEAFDIFFPPLDESHYIIALDESGKNTSSVDLAKRIQKARLAGQSDIHFLIGPAEGHDPKTRQRANAIISFGRATWPHMMVRAMLAEQLYRAESIISGHPYHKS